MGSTLGQVQDLTRRAEGLVFRGRADGTVVVIEDDAERGLPLRLDLFRHSPAGFAWGYNGSGPAQLALAMTAEVVGDDWAQLGGLYQQVKERLIAGLHRGQAWEIRGADVLRVVLQTERDPA